jgi:sulfate permease, SulP family
MVNYVHAVLRAASDFLVPTFLRKGNQYSIESLRADIMAGLTVAVIQIPQSMAFAIIAGLPAVYGLYASLPGFIASLWGSSRQLSTGPVAVISLLTFTSLVPLAEPGSPEFIRLAGLLALLVGSIYLLMGFFRLGYIMHLVPQSVVVGFSSAAAAIIVITQLPALLGIPSERHELVFQSILDLVFALPNLSMLTLGVGLGACVLLLSFQRLPKIFPSALVVLAVGIGATYLFDLGELGLALVAQVPSTLPSFTMPSLAAIPFLSLLPKAAIIALVGFVGTHATAKNAAEKTKEHLDTDQELVGQGLANIVAGFFKGYPISGSFTRTAITIDAGAKTGIAGLVATIVTLVVLIFFTPIFVYLPHAVLAAIVIIAALPLISLPRLHTIYRVSKTDGYVAYLTFGIAFLFKPDDAIFIGIVAALMLFVHRTAWGARVSEVGVDREWHILSASIDKASVETYKGVCIARIGMSMYYANATHLMNQLDELLKNHRAGENAPVRFFVLDFSGVHFIDSTALETFAEYLDTLEVRKIEVALIYLRRDVRNSLTRMQRIKNLTILHNIEELKQFGLRDERVLVLSSTHPEKLRGETAF